MENPAQSAPPDTGPTIRWKDGGDGVVDAQGIFGTTVSKLHLSGFICAPDQVVEVTFREREDNTRGSVEAVEQAINAFIDELQRAKREAFLSGEA